MEWNWDRQKTEVVSRQVWGRGAHPLCKDRLAEESRMAVKVMGRRVQKAALEGEGERRGG